MEANVPPDNNTKYKKWATFLNLSPTDRRWLAKQESGYFIIRTIDVWEDKSVYRVYIEAKIVRPPKPRKEFSNKVEKANESK